LPLLQYFSGDGEEVLLSREGTIKLLTWNILGLPIEESLDYVLGTNFPAIVNDVEILQGYDDDSVKRTLSDHHPSPPLCASQKRINPLSV
jgi:hypothetical protein